MEIKGIKEGLLIILEERDWRKARHNLITQIEDQQDFFQGADVVLDLGKHVLETFEIPELKEELSFRGLVLTGIFSPFSVTQDAAQCLGLLTIRQTQQMKTDILPKQWDTILSSDDLQKMRDQIITVISDYMNIDGDGAEIIMSGQGSEPRLIISIPLRNPELRS